MEPDMLCNDKLTKYDDTDTPKFNIPDGYGPATFVFLQQKRSRYLF
jgi:hypothetical protein